MPNHAMLQHTKKSEANYIHTGSTGYFKNLTQKYTYVIQDKTHIMNSDHVTFFFVKKYCEINF